MYECSAALWRQIYDCWKQKEETYDRIESSTASLFTAGPLMRADIRSPLETFGARYGAGLKMGDWYFQDRPKLSPKQTALLKRLAVGLHGEDLDEMNQILARFAS